MCLQSMQLIDSCSSWPDVPLRCQSPSMQVSLRLERMQLIDQDLRMLAAWAQGSQQTVRVRKLWLFENQLGDDGAQCVALMLHPGMLEVGHTADS